MPKPLSDSPNPETARARQNSPRPPITESDESKSNSTLIEFPGTSRAVPEWRKRLSQRVREIQEQKAREAAEADAAARAADTVSCSLPSGQLELVPEREHAPLNPIVSKALERVERARRAERNIGACASTAAAPALSKVALEVSEDLADVPIVETKSRLAIVPAVQNQVPPRARSQPALPIPDPVEAFTETVPERKRSVRVISDTVEDAALSYLDTCLSVPALSTDTRKDIAGLARRTIVGVLDLIVIAAMVSPMAGAMEVSQTAWSDPRATGLLAAFGVIVTFAYMTISIALTGRTLAMRLLGVRAIDARTGLIPTGGQSIRRALGYVVSLSLFGLGLAMAFIDRDHRTLHDRFSNTIVVRT